MKNQSKWEKVFKSVKENEWVTANMKEIFVKMEMPVAANNGQGAKL